MLRETSHLVGDTLTRADIAQGREGLQGLWARFNRYGGKGVSGSGTTVARYESTDACVSAVCECTWA